VDYNYGTGADDIDEFFREKRSWSKVKDTIFAKYLDAYLHKVHQLQKPILVVDGFAGPGIFGDNSEGSPLIACRVAKANLRGVPIRCCFADVRRGHRAALSKALSAEIQASLAIAPFNDCASVLAHAIEKHPRDTIFFYLDPYGIKDLEFDTVRRIYERMERVSSEVLMNFSYRAFMRLSGNWNYADSASKIAAEVKKEKIETVDRVMGGEYWRDIIFDPSLSSVGREEAVISAYLGRIREVCPYAYAVPVKEPREDAPGLPDDELAHYHLVFATRTPDAVLFMNDIGLSALEAYFDQFKEGAAAPGGQMLLLDVTPDRYKRVSADKAKAALIEAATPRPVTRDEIYKMVIPKFFMQHKKKIYRAWIDELFKAGRLFADPRVKLHRGQLNEKVRLWTRPWN
jgi:three-Cys-motif partner protein